MSKYSIQDILPLVEKPSRYLGTETNTIKKDPSTVRLRIALAFPDLYEIGTSHFGLLILYHILNQYKEIAAERVFVPGLDMEAKLRTSKLPILSLESQTPLLEFDIVGFSLLYELNYTNILSILDLSNIPFYASQRDNSFPLIIAGGPCTCNPEPVADLFDAMVIGDGENVILEMSDIWFGWNKSSRGDKDSLLRQWSRLEGVYVPAYFKPRFDTSRYQTVEPRFSDYTRVTRTITSNLDQAPFPEAPVVPFGRPVHDRLRLEVSRGCTRGCRFCQAGIIYRPVRERSMEKLIDLTTKSLEATGYEDMSLLSLSTGDYACIVPLLECLMTRYQASQIAISLPSLRAGTLTAELMRLIKRVRKTGFTIAPEAGSQRLRDVINKNVSDEDIKDTVKNAFDLGWRLIKLYFMIGLPTETEDDLHAMVDLVKDLRKLKGSQGFKGKINVSLSAFIPKPHTPFQWVAQNSLTESFEKLKWIKKNLNLPGVHLKWQNPQVSILEGLWSRGDRRLSRLLVSAYDKGCKFDGWSDKFRFDAWMEACAQVGCDIDFYTLRVRDVFEPLPWDHIDTKVEKKFLRQEWARALKCELTHDCRSGDCNSCGVCDFKSVAPEIFQTCDKVPVKSEKVGNYSEPVYNRYTISYSKTGQAKYWGHLEMAKIFLRAIRRAKIPMKYSQGFHPKPKVSFEDPLPIGLESLSESMHISVPENISRQSIVTGLNRHLPDGLLVHDCQPVTRPRNKSDKISATYDVFLESRLFDHATMTRFLQKSEFFIARTNRHGKLNKIDLRTEVLHLEMISPTHLKITLKTNKGAAVRPGEVLKFVFQFSDYQIRRARVVKLNHGYVSS
jgi:radical SAM family uncharacterized protein/radical SAM-linked protein